MFKISQQVIKHEQVDVAIVHPATKQPLGPVIKLAGRHTAAHKAAQAALLAGDTKKLTAAESEARLLDYLTRLTVAWDGIVDEHDQPIPCTAEHVRALYAGEEWLASQVADAAGQTDRFFGIGTAS